MDLLLDDRCEDSIVEFCLGGNDSTKLTWLVSNKVEGVQVFMPVPVMELSFVAHTSSSDEVWSVRWHCRHPYLPWSHT
jgi:hypothetical protein